IAMGRKAGHLALGIGLPAGATLTIIPEEFGDEKISFSLLVNIIVGSIVKRYIDGRHYGVVVLAEGLADKLDESSIPELQDVERDPHGNIRFAELDFGGMVKNGVRKRLAQLGLPKMLVVDKNVGYELRCAAPNAFDREYTRVLGFGVIDFLLQGGTDAMISRQRDNLVPIPFQNILDRDTGRIRIRLVDTRADVFRASRKYMIRLTVADLENDQFVGKLSELTGKTPAELRTEFAPAAAAAHGVAEGASQSSNEG
ncbi:MAG: 6-phosphofructokinase, partial [Deltaproteobacteria bacterium]|nr:6-phosphofructokinase [Deltaproteobacteria bacterium]